MPRRPRSGDGRRRAASIVLSSSARHFTRLSCVYEASTTPRSGPAGPATLAELSLARSPTGARARIGPIGSMQRGEIWFVATPGGARPVLVLTHDPVADRIGAVVVAALTRTHREIVSELALLRRRTVFRPTAWSTSTTSTPFRGRPSAVGSRCYRLGGWLRPAGRCATRPDADDRPDHEDAIRGGMARRPRVGPTTGSPSARQATKPPMTSVASRPRR